MRAHLPKEIVKIFYFLFVKLTQQEESDLGKRESQKENPRPACMRRSVPLGLFFRIPVIMITYGKTNLKAGSKNTMIRLFTRVVEIA